MSSIFELSSQYQRVMSIIMDVEEIDNELMKELENIADDLDNKILNYASIIKNIEAKAQSILKAADDMVKRAEQLNNNANRLREIVKKHMSDCNKDKVENDYHALKLRLNNPKVNLINKDIIPLEYFRREIKEIIEPNKMLILKNLKENISIPGVCLVRDIRLEIK